MEIPNLEYIEKLARGNESIRNTLIEVIKTEFPEEKKKYQNSIEKKDFKEIEDNVHRIKHKFSILGLETSYEKANEFEKNLREHNLDPMQKAHFDQTLLDISLFLKTI
ncbi:histidine kinase [Polaribacter reichenbachii]|uniref:Histidine kinase n=1 Tax=Polaribacter reichenbachii TaxID=996801 RepID=A0A1B8U5D2_9FLAO|nr:Hpt domain-containing protein [Polaribacter reichenbachii]APZ47576.1 histidine kinase [Polaribacter reichenbachii]AUC18216.1 histidine kinase [Polaribacter reichenbachii]OBY67071.1 histidine kinase [Polaribacter reichenbachii]